MKRISFFFIYLRRFFLKSTDYSTQMFGSKTYFLISSSEIKKKSQSQLGVTFYLRNNDGSYSGVDC